MESSANLQKSPHDHLFSIVIIGDPSVGKTCFMMKFADNEFSPNYKPTIGIDFKCKKIRVANKVVKLQVWDTAGQERFRTISQTYYQRADGIILAYDCTNAKSFENLNIWLAQIADVTKEGLPKVIISTKCDMPSSQKVVNRANAETMTVASGEQLRVFETSSKDGTNIETVFTELAKLIL